MKKIILALALLLTAPVAAAPDYPALNADAGQRHIIPRYATLAAATAALDKTAQEFCAGAKSDVTGLQREWRTAMSAWQGVQHLRFGPGEWLNRVQRFAFWPDPRNVTTRQLADLFNKRDASALEPQKFVTGSVAVQGLSALERVLFEPAEAAKFSGEPYRCDWLKAVTANLAMMAREIHAAWAGPPHDYARDFLSHAEGMRREPNPSEATLDLFKSLHTAIELVADHKLARPLGESAKASRPRLAESPRSEASLASIRENLAAARDLFERLRPGIAEPALATEIATRFDAVVAALSGIRGSLEEAVGDPARRPAVERARREAFALKKLIAERLTVALDLPLGFNALDGD